MRTNLTQSQVDGADSDQSPRFYSPFAFPHFLFFLGVLCDERVPAFRVERVVP